MSSAVNPSVDALEFNSFRASESVSSESALATLRLLQGALESVGSPRWRQIVGAFQPFLKSEI